MPARQASPAEDEARAARARARHRATLRGRLEGKRICICAGPGGVGKTTIAAAVGFGLAREGRRVLVLTIDPARRLAGALGLGAPAAATSTAGPPVKSGEPMRVDPARLSASGVRVKGELWAMTLDVKRTFDDLIAELAPDQRACEKLLSNRIYTELSSAAAGSQEVAAVAKLFELAHEQAFDVVVLDTPPSRNALDFLEAPTRLSSFLEGRAMDIFTLGGSSLRAAPLLPQLAPKAMASRLLGGGTALLFSVFARATGVEMAGDIAVFFRLLSSVRDGLRERASSVEALLRDDATTFLIVTSPEHEPAQEAVFLHSSLQAAAMSYGALIVNRVHEGGLQERELKELRTLLGRRLGARLGARVIRSVADFDVLARRDAEILAFLSRALAERAPVIVPELGDDVDDLAGLARVAERLLG
jgi:anion-transporting  ArsA/GET3 family ATPase